MTNMSTRTTALALAVRVGLALAVGVTTTATAGPTPRTALKLSCDRGTGDAEVTVQLEDTIFGSPVGAPITLSCGPDSISGLRSDSIVDIKPGVGAAQFNSFFVTTAQGTFGCLGEGTLPLKLSCVDANGVGPTLVIR
jgi:hypothetical protein